METHAHRSCKMGETDMNKAAGWLLGVAFALVVLIFILITIDNPLGGAQPYKQPILESALSVVTSLFVVALLIERSLAIVNSLIWGEEQRKVELQLVDGKDKADARKSLAEVMAKKERLRLLLGFVAALFVSAVGIRTLQGLVELSAPSALFYPVDVLLTAGLLAGGSNGLAFLIQFLKDMMTRDPSKPAPTLRSRLVTTT